MDNFLPILNVVVPVFGIAVIGAAMRKRGWLTEDADQSLLRVTINLLIPSLIFHSILNNEALRQIGNVVFPPLIGFATVTIGIGLGLLSRRATGLDTKVKERTFAYALAVYNYGFVPIPLTLLLFDQETAGVLFVHNVGVELAMWTIGLVVLTFGGLREFWRQFFNPPVAAILIGLTLNLSGTAPRVPGFVIQAAEMLGNCAIPMGLILVGATIADYIHQFQSGPRWRVILVACVLRLGLLPLIFLMLALQLPVSVELKRVMAIQAAMPAASFPILISKHYGGDPQTALQVVLGTSLLGLLTIPLWISFGTWLLDL